jgi:hypothetical protein
MSVILSRLCVELGVKVRPGVWRGADWIKEDAASPETPAADQPARAASPLAAQLRPAPSAPPLGQSARPSPPGFHAPP